MGKLSDRESLCWCPLMRFKSGKEKEGFMWMSASLLLCVFLGYICSSKLVPVSQYVGTVLVCLLGVACLRGEATDFK